MGVPGAVMPPVIPSIAGPIVFGRALSSRGRPHQVPQQVPACLRAVFARARTPQGVEHAF